MSCITIASGRSLVGKRDQTVNESASAPLHFLAILRCSDGGELIAQGA